MKLFRATFIVLGMPENKEIIYEIEARTAQSAEKKLYKILHYMSLDLVELVEISE